ncbi:MAG TPA: sugar phosphate nucleotidyltransferase [Desulfovibrio sp.]|nr:sugar phosphate nucleotidyltransferase [Desulfovibrio sp.]HZF60583.1 sugar phosphate nucleotidyltransferase [Desulfovibrio sp.]
MQNIAPVILCGGRGTRLWPLSRETYPKQFVDLGGGKTLFKDTVLRAKHTPDSLEPVIVCNEAHHFYVTAELYECGVHGKILLEPAPRNTAPALRWRRGLGCGERHGRGDQWRSGQAVYGKTR